MNRSGSRGKPLFLINLFSRILLAFFFVLIWVFGLFWKVCLFSRSLPAQHQNDLSSFIPVSGAWHTRADLLFPGRSLWDADAYLSHVHFWHDCDSCVHHSISFLCFTFHSTKLSFTNPFLGVHNNKVLQGRSGSTRLSLLFLVCSSILGYAKGYTTITKILMLHPRTLK